MSRFGLGFVALSGLGLLAPGPVWAQAQPKSKASAAAAKKDAKPKAQPTAPDVDDKSAPDANPAMGPSAKFLPSEVFRDDKAKALLDVSRFTELRARPVIASDLESFKSMAADANINLDRNVIDRVVESEAARLTNHANLQALIDPPPGTNPNSPVLKAINEATNTLLEPLFVARSIKNQGFLRMYDQILIQRLQPLLKNHMISRIQAMIILGQSATAQDIPIFLAELKNPTQTIWVKLWALEGLSNVVDNGARLSAAAQIDAAKAVAEFLDRGEDLPWPAQYRALQTLAAMRQGFIPSTPKQAHMASTAMRLLCDADSKPEVRAEAARALGSMQITSAVPKYNYPLVAHAIGELAASVGGQVGTTYTHNQVKARYLTALLAGPIFEAFNGLPGTRDSGLIHETTGEPAAYSQKVFELVKAIIKASADLLVSPTKLAPERIKDLNARVDALKAHLEKNPPADRRLVQGGPEFPSTLAGQAALPAAANQPLAGPATRR